MQYTIFMRKTKGDPSPFHISVLLNRYFNICKDENAIVIAFPGYMSTYQNNIDDFINSIDFPKNTYFIGGMNGNALVKPHGNCSIQDAHNNHKKFNFTVTGLKKSSLDHAKMIFILNNPSGANNIDACDLLNLDVKAALIGSSNQSFNTYFSLKADKGEADLFLINGDYFKHLNKSTSQDDEALRLFGITNYQQESRENQTIEQNKTNNIALYKEFNPYTTLNLNKVFREAIQNLFE